MLARTQTGEFIAVTVTRAGDRDATVVARLFQHSLPDTRRLDLTYCLSGTHINKCYLSPFELCILYTGTKGKKLNGFPRN